MENGIEVIVISDDEEETSSQEPQNPVIVITDDSDVSGSADESLLGSRNDLRVELNQAPPSSSLGQSRTLTPLRISSDKIQWFKAKVKIRMLDPELFNRPKKLSPAKLENGVRPCSLQTTPKKEIKNDDGNECSVKHLKLEEGLFETVQRKFSTSPKNKRNPHIKNNMCHKSASKDKRSYQTPPSSPLKQSKLTAQSFSPKHKLSPYICLKQDQSLPYTMALYCTMPSRFFENSANTSQTFSENQLNSIQALKEENFHKLILETVVSFMSQRKKPPVMLLFYLLNYILLSKQCSLGPECFRVLREIQVLHPAVPAQMMGQKLTWEFITMVVNLSQCAKDSASSSLDKTDLAVNASMALAFIGSVMEDELQKKTFSVMKTSAFKLLCPYRQSRHVRDVISWIELSVQGHSITVSSCGYNLCPLLTLQRFLLLSLLVSERPKDTSTRVADELVLVYMRLQALYHKTLLLQSIQSHLLRTKLIEGVASICYQSRLGEDDNTHFNGGLRNFVSRMFVLSQAISSTLSEGPSACAVHADSYEEFIMLMVYWVQSYLFTHKRTLRKNTSDSLPELSKDDVDVLSKLDDTVARLIERLETLFSPLSHRSYQLLDMMLSLKSFASL